MYIAYTIDTAAEHSNISAGILAEAIRGKQLTAYRIDGQAYMLPADLTTWVTTHPRF